MLTCTILRSHDWLPSLPLAVVVSVMFRALGLPGVVGQAVTMQMAQGKPFMKENRWWIDFVNK